MERVKTFFTTVKEARKGTDAPKYAHDVTSADATTATTEEQQANPALSWRRREWEWRRGLTAGIIVAGAVAFLIGVFAVNGGIPAVHPSLSGPKQYLSRWQLRGWGLAVLAGLLVFPVSRLWESRQRRTSDTRGMEQVDGFTLLIRIALVGICALLTYKLHQEINAQEQSGYPSAGPVAAFWSLAAIGFGLIVGFRPTSSSLRSRRERKRAAWTTGVGIVVVCALVLSQATATENWGVHHTTVHNLPAGAAVPATVGHVGWITKLPDGVDDAVAAGSGFVVSSSDGTGNGQIVGLDGRNGHVLWTYSHRNVLPTDLVASRDGRLVAAVMNPAVSGPEMIIVLSAATGRRISQFADPAPHPELSGDLALVDGVVATVETVYGNGASWAKAVTAFSATTGRRLWSHLVSPTGREAETWTYSDVGDGLLLATSLSNPAVSPQITWNLQSLDPHTGAQRWELPTSDGVPLVAPDGQLITEAPNRLYDGTTGQAIPVPPGNTITGTSPGRTVMYKRSDGTQVTVNLGTGATRSGNSCDASVQPAYRVDDFPAVDLSRANVCESWAPQSLVKKVAVSPSSGASQVISLPLKPPAASKADLSNLPKIGYANLVAGPGSVVAFWPAVGPGYQLVALQ